MNQLSSNLSFLFVGKISEFFKLNYSWCTILYKLQVHNIVIHNFLSLHSTTITTTSLQSCPTLCDPIDGSPPDSPTPGILQARTLEWVAISFSNAWKWKVKIKSLSRVWPLATPWTAAYQAPPSMGVSRQEYRSRVPLPSPKTPPYLTLKIHWKLSSSFFGDSYWPKMYCSILFPTDSFLDLKALSILQSQAQMPLPPESCPGF